MKKTFRREAETACEIVKIIEDRMKVTEDLNLCVVREFCERMLKTTSHDFGHDFGREIRGHRTVSMP